MDSNKFYNLDFNTEIDYENDINRSIQDYSEFVFEYLSDIKRGLLNNDQDIEEKADVLIDYAWEKLNTNLWVFVDKKWRYLYAYSTLYKILCSRNKLESSEIIKLCDLGLLMSGPLLEKQFNQIIKFISTATSTAANEESFGKKRKYENSSSDYQVEFKIDKKFSLDIQVSPSVEKFQQDYYLTNIPVIICNQMSHWPAMEKWNVEYIRKIAGKRTVPIEIGTYLLFKILLCYGKKSLTIINF